MISNGFIGKLIGILLTSVLPEFDRETLMDKIPFLYSEEAKEIYEMLMNNQLCPMTQLAHFSNKGVHIRLDIVMLNDRL